MLESKKSYDHIKENRTLLRIFYIFLGAVTISLLYIFRFYFWPFLFAILLYMALRPICDKLKQFVRFDSLASIIMIVGMCSVVFIPVIILLLGIADQAMDFYEYVQNELQRAEIIEWLSSNVVAQWMYAQFNLNRGEIFSRVIKFLQQTSLSIFTNLTAVVTFSVNFVMNFVFMVLILFFLFKDGYKLDKAFYRILPFPDDIEQDVVKRLKEVVKILFLGNLFIMMLQGFFLGLGFYIAKIPGVLLWSSIGAILSVIPVIGTMLVWVPVAVVLTIKGSYLMAIFVAIWSLGWYLVLENLLKPAIFGKSLKFHPLVFFFLLIGSIKAFGLSGIILGPVLLTLFYSLWEIYKLVSGMYEG